MSDPYEDSHVSYDASVIATNPTAPPARRLAVVNQKGGVGKTATALGMAGALAELKRRVLLVDWDPQGHLTEALGAPEATPPATVAARVLGQWSGPARELVWSHPSAGVDLLPTNVDAFLLAAHLYPSRGKEFRLSALLDELAADYDDILIDCPPELGVLTDNALWAVREPSAEKAPDAPNGVIIPAEAEDSSLRALSLLLAQIDSLQKQLNAAVTTLGLVINAYDSRRGGIVTSTMQALSELPNLRHLAVIEDLKWVREAWRNRVPVVHYAPDSPTAQQYRDLTATVHEKSQSA